MSRLFCVVLVHMLIVSLNAVEEVRLSALDLSRIQQAVGKPGIDRTFDDKPLCIAGHDYANGLGTHAPSALYVALQGGSTRFTAQVGINDQGTPAKTNGSVEFIIEGDGKVLWCSPLMRGAMPAQAVDLDVTGIRNLALRVSDGFDGSNRDHAVWADATFQVTGAKPTTMAAPPTPPRWTLGDNMTTVWSVAKDVRLPHVDFIEQGGLRVGQVVSYKVDAQHALSMKRSVVWPTLRKKKNGTFGTTIREYRQEADPVITVDGAPFGAITVDHVTLDGTLMISGHAGQDLLVTRCAFPSSTVRTAIDRWTLRNNGKTARTIAVAPLAIRHQDTGFYGVNVVEVSCTAPASSVLEPGKELTFAVLFTGHMESEPIDKIDIVADEKARRAHVAALQKDLRLETPEPELDLAFAFCKLRVAEAINATRGGMILAPGGLAYYAAAWCNDNVEYAGPFFPFLGDQNGNQASLDTYRLFQPFMKPGEYAKKIPYSMVGEGLEKVDHQDRGDAAMYAYGCARFCLARGDKAIAKELWPAIVWCLEYCKFMTTPDGVIASQSDELEGRLPTGKANLSTSSLCYGGLRSAADLARALGLKDDAIEFDKRAVVLAKAIESYFGSTVEGFATYRYYEGNDVLRSWICLPLCMGLTDRRDGTIAALFSPRLWTSDGLASQAGDLAFWDRSTLYGLRGVFQAGETATALQYLSAYTKRRLLGDHVPYPVEAWPEGDQRHLSSESALYCRIITEGMFGMQPTGLDRFRCTPRLPADWPRMALRSVRAFGRTFDVVVERRNKRLHVSVTQEGRVITSQELAAGDTVDVRFP